MRELLIRSWNWRSEFKFGKKKKLHVWIQKYIIQQGLEQDDVDLEVVPVQESRLMLTASDES